MKRVRNRQTNSTKARTFFAVYFCVITVAFVWSLFNCTEYSWKGVDAFLGGEEGVSVSSEPDILKELKDGAPIETFIPEDSSSSIEKKLRLRGVALLGYDNIHSLQFSDETLKASVIDAHTEEIVSEGTMLLKNQTHYKNDETMIYIALSQPVSDRSPGDLKVLFSTSGMTRNGIGLRGEQGSIGEGEKVPAARLFYEKKIWNPIMPFLYFLVEAAMGLGCLLLYGEKKLPLFRRAGKSELRRPLLEDADLSENEKKGRRIPSLKVRDIVIPLVLIIVLMIPMLFTYLRVIRQTAGSSSADLLTGGTLSEETVVIVPGTRVRQEITAGKNDFAGIGIRLADEKGSGISAGEETPFSDTVLEWKILDETGTAQLTGGSGTVKELKKAAAVLEKDIADEEILTAAGESVLLPLDQIQRESQGKKYVLEIGVPSTEQQTVYLRAVADTNGIIETTASGQTDLNLEMCLLGTYRCNGFIKGMFARLSIVLLILIPALYFASRYFARSFSDQGKKASRQVAAMYLVSALCMGLVFSFMTPAYTISDERTHIDSIYVLSNHLLGISESPGPRRLLKRSCDFDSSIANTMPVTAERYKVVEENLFGPAPKSDYIAAYTRDAADNVPILCYLPAAIGFSAARILGRNMVTMIMMARWLNLFACVLVTYLALRRMPYGAPAMAVIGLFPKTLQQMSSCSYDGMIIAGTYLFIALCLTAAYDEEMCIADLLAFLLASVFVASCKGGAYLPILGMVLLIPAARTASAGRGKSGIRWRIVSISALICSIFLFAGKYVIRLAGMFGRKSGSYTIAAGTKTLYTLSDFIHAPMKLIWIYLNTIDLRLDGLIGELVGKNLSQKWFIVYTFLALAVLGMLRRNSAIQKNDPQTAAAGTEDCPEINHLRIAGRLWILFIAAISTALIFLSMLIAFTSRDLGYIDGLQGRYFLPLAPLPLLALETGRIHRNGIEDTAILFAADFLLAVTFFEILLFYLG